MQLGNGMGWEDILFKKHKETKTDEHHSQSVRCCIQSNYAYAKTRARTSQGARCERHSVCLSPLALVPSIPAKEM